MSNKAKRQKTSDIWNFFTPSEIEYYATCNMCNKNLSFKTTNSNLKKHIKSNHPLVKFDTDLNKGRNTSEHGQVKVTRAGDEACGSDPITSVCSGSNENVPLRI